MIAIESNLSEQFKMQIIKKGIQFSDTLMLIKYDTMSPGTACMGKFEFLSILGDTKKKIVLRMFDQRHKSRYQWTNLCKFTNRMENNVRKTSRKDIITAF